MLQTFFQILLYFSNNFPCFIKNMDVVLSKSILNALNFGKDMSEDLIF